METVWRSRGDPVKIMATHPISPTSAGGHQLRIWDGVCHGSPAGPPDPSCSTVKPQVSACSSGSFVILQVLILASQAINFAEVANDGADGPVKLMVRVWRQPAVLRSRMSSNAAPGRSFSTLRS